MKKIRVRKYKHPVYKFVVNFRENGNRRRKFFENRTHADSFAELKNIELVNHGREHAEFDSRLRVMAQECASRLRAYGKTLMDATEFFVRHLAASEKSCTVAELVDQLITAKKSDGASQRHLQDLRHRLRRFARDFGDNIVATISTKEIDDWLRALHVAPVTRNNFRRVLVAMFNYAVKRGYATDNPAEKTEKAREPKLKPGILTVTQAARLLESATPDILPYIAIGLFAGLRRAELERLDWSEIDFAEGHIEVTAEKSKSKIANRFIPIQPNLREWLFPFRKVRGNVTPRGNFRQLFDQARVAAGITAWPDNALRHSFASYHVANFKDAKSLALEMGHTDSGMLYNHYRALVRPKEAERYWNIRPTPVSKVVPMRSKSSAEIKAYMRTAKIAKIGDGSQLPDNFLSANYLSTRKCTLTKSARARISAALI